MQITLLTPSVIEILLVLLIQRGLERYQGSIATQKPSVHFSDPDYFSLHAPIVFISILLTGSSSPLKLFVILLYLHLGLVCLETYFVGLQYRNLVRAQSTEGELEGLIVSAKRVKIIRTGLNLFLTFYVMIEIAGIA